MKQFGLLLVMGVLLMAMSGCYARVTTYSYPPPYYQSYYGGHYYKPHYNHRGHYRSYYYRGYQRRHY